MRPLLIVLLLASIANARPGGAGAPFVPPTHSAAGGTGDITGVTAGLGLTGGATSGNATLSADTSFLQRLVSGICAPGSSIRAIAADGTVTCETDDNTTYSAGAGLGLAGTTFSANLAGGACSTGFAATSLSATGTLSCTAITEITQPLTIDAGVTITGGATTDSLNVGVISPSPISGTVDDWNPTGLQTAAIVQIATSADVNLNGIAAPTGSVGGRQLCLRNTGTNSINIPNEALTSAANNRFSTVGGVQWRLFGGNHGTVCFFYDVAAHRWSQFEKLNYPQLAVGASGGFSVDSQGNVNAAKATFNGIFTSIQSFDQSGLSVPIVTQFTTAGGAITSYGVNSVNSSTRVSGASLLTNIAGYFSSTSGDVNYGIKTGAGDNYFNTISGISEFHGGVTIDTGVTVTDKDGASRPTVTTCGTSPTLVGNDHSGVVTVGTGGSSACTITLHNPLSANGSCTAFLRGNASTYNVTTSGSNVTGVTLTAALSGGAKIDYHCTEHN